MSFPLSPDHVDEVDDFLAHFGVKGMKWGQRKSDGSSSGISRAQMKSAGLTAAKVAVRYGGPAALGVAAGAAATLGAPISLPTLGVLGISAKILSDPAIQPALSAGAAFTKSVAKDVGNIPLPKLPKYDNPFTLSTAEKARLKTITTRANQIAAEANAQSKKLDDSFGTRTTTTSEAITPIGRDGTAYAPYRR